MANRISIFERRYTDVDYVEGASKGDKRVQEALYRHCKRYLEDHYEKLFFDGDVRKDEVMQESFITLWTIIEKKRIFVEDGVLKGKNGKRLTSNLTTFFIGIALLKYKEQTRSMKNNAERQEWDEVEKEVSMAIYDANDEEHVFAQLDYIDECMSQMPEKCRMILSLFYYEGKTMADILPLIPDVENEHALRTAKYRCMENLRQCARMMYEQYLKE